MDANSAFEPLTPPLRRTSLGIKHRLRMLASKPQVVIPALVILIVFGGGILALTQRSLKDSQETRSDASQDEVKIWAGFMSDPAAAGADPVALTSIDASPLEPTEVGIWLNNPYMKPLGAMALYVEHDPTAISLEVPFVSQSSLTSNQQPKTMTEEINSEGTKKIDVLAAVAKCDASACYPIRTIGSQWLKVATARITPNAGFTGQTQIKIVTNTDNSRSLVLATDTDASLLQSTGYLTLDVNFGGTPSEGPSPTGPAKPAKVTGLTTLKFCTENSDASGVTLNWNQVSGATGYQVQFCKGTNCSSWENLAKNQAENLYDHRDLSAGLHRYQVRAKNSAGNGAYSDTAQIQIGATCVGVTPTTSPSATPAAGVPQKGIISSVVPNCTARKIQVNWDAITDATKYQLQFCKGANCNGTDFANLITSAQNFTNLSYLHETITPGVFKYRMRGINAAGPGAWSNVQQARLEATCTGATPTASATPLLTATQSPTFTPQATATSTPTQEPSPTITPDSLMGDFDNDGNVSLAELQRVMDAYGQTGDVPENVNADDEVDLLDVTLVLANFLH